MWIPILPPSAQSHRPRCAGVLVVLRLALLALPPPSSLLPPLRPSFSSRSPPFTLALGRCRPGQSALLPFQASREEKKSMADSLVEVLAGDMNVESELDAITEVRAHLVVSLTRFVLLSSLKPSLNFTPRKTLHLAGRLRTAVKRRQPRAVLLGQHCRHALGDQDSRPVSAGGCYSRVQHSQLVSRRSRVRVRLDHVVGTA